jgi:hypothetical protein
MRMKHIPDATTILTETQVAFVTKQLRGLLIRSFPGVERFTHNVERTVRMMALSANCRQAREKRGLSIKDVAAQLRVPQYRLKAVEAPSTGSLKPEYLRAYIHFLDLTKWARRWAAANPALAQELGIDNL